MRIQNINKIEVPVNLSKKYIKKVIESSPAGMNQTFYLEGPSGIGKSEIVAQLAKELNAELFDIRLGSLDVIDLNGIGIPDIENKKAIWTRPENFPPENSNKNFILFLDEFNHANEAVMGAAYQLVLERRMGVHKFPKNMLIIAAGNSIDDKGIAFTMPSPLQNRFMKIHVIPEIESFLEYADSKSISWKIKGYLKANPDDLHKFDPKIDESNFPTPRNWFKLNEIIESFDDDKLYSQVILNSLFGMKIQIKFLTYLELIGKFPKVEDILNGKKNKLKLVTDIGSSYAFYMLIKNYFINNINNISHTQFINLIKFAEKQDNQEIMQMMILELISYVNKNLNKEELKKLHLQFFQNEKLILNNKNFKEEMKKFHSSMK